MRLNLGAELRNGAVFATRISDGTHMRTSVGPSANTQLGPADLSSDRLAH